MLESPEGDYEGVRLKQSVNPETPEQSPGAVGPLVVSDVNPRYFTVRSGRDVDQRAVYLTGSHIWNNFHDGMGPGADCAETPEQLEWSAYLTFLKDHGHNFIRLWRWEQFKSQAAGGNFHLCMTPQPWLRTGPGTAKDGQPKFDLESFDAEFFNRLRERIMAAGDAGVYVAVMLFDGWALHLSPAPDNVEGHPFHAGNNTNGVGIKSIVDYQVLPLDTRIQALQEAYIRKVVDTVQNLPNVLYEVANESSGGGSVDGAFADALGLGDPPDWGDSTEWQYWVINSVKQYEREMGYSQHPIGMTMQFPVADQTRVNDPLFNGPADWISPGYDDAIFTGGGHPMAPGSPPSRWFDNPPAADGRKVIISDTDHFAPGQGDALWAWKSFLRGHHPILMDFGLIGGVQPDSPEYAAFEAARYAMGDTLRYAQQMNLVAMQPRGDLSSTGYVLASPGHEYLVLQPMECGEPFTVWLEPGSYSVEWHTVATRQTRGIGRMTAESSGNASFRAPSTSLRPVVLHLKNLAH
jgi:hypothetical protein